MPRTRPALSAARHEQALELGRRLAAARAEAGYSQAAAATALGIAQSAIAKIELGLRYVSFVEALDLAALYGVTPSDLDPRKGH